MSEEASLRFRCFGCDVTLHLGHRDGDSGVDAALESARRRLLSVHQALSRFVEDSELSRLNRSAAEALPASPLMRMFVHAAAVAGRRSGGLVDVTLVDEIERAGYRTSLEQAGTLPLREALAAAGRTRRPASPNPAGRWRELRADDRDKTVSRPAGVRLDSGGVAKGLAADLIGAGLRGHPTYAVDCGGDIRIGGSASLARRVRVDDPFGGAPLHEFEVREGAVATSGIGRRAWVGPGGLPAHHLLDPATGRPAFTGIVQATALAPTARLAEVLAKTALLGGPSAAAASLPYGGCVVLDDGSFEVVEGAPITSIRTGPPSGLAMSR